MMSWPKTPADVEYNERQAATMAGRERGRIASEGQYNDFRRCAACHEGYHVNALGRTPAIECPACSHQQARA